ncbi:MAG: MarC family protein [Waddliaceae bacterium]
MNIFNLAVTFFLVANPVGNSPAIIALIKDFDIERQKKIMLREAILGFFLALFFQYFGEVFLNQIEIKNYTLQISGGVLLLLVALNMIFSPKSPNVNEAAEVHEPLLVPIATPLISGPALLTIIMLYSHQESSHLKISLAIALSWLAITLVLVSAPYLQRILRKRGLAALEQLMGLFLTLMAVEMVVQGLALFIRRV